MKRAQTRYAAAADGVQIAYQVFGRGDFDLVFIPGWMSHVELNWQEPAFAAFLERLAEFSRVIVIDKRGTGCSDRVDTVPDLETRMEDVRAVLDAVGAPKVVLVGESSGAAMSALFAATYPDRTRALVLGNARARARWAPDYPWGMRRQEYAAELELLRGGWDSGEFVRKVVLPLVAPSLADDAAFVDRFVRYHQAACSRDDAIAMTEMWWEIDYRAILPAISVPTLVLSTQANAEESEYIAGRIPGAHQRALAVAGSEMWMENSSAVTDAIGEFLHAVTDEEADFERVLATVVFTDIVDSTSQAASLGDRRWEAIRREHDAIVNSHLTRYRGRAVKSTGDGFLATFEGPARAVRCSLAIAEAIRRLGIEIRAGLHTGEVEYSDGDVHGLAVSIAARVAATAGPSQVVVSQTVRDLVAGSGIRLDDAGLHDLKGVPGHWHLYRAVRTTTPAPLK